MEEKSIISVMAINHDRNAMSRDSMPLAGNCRGGLLPLCPTTVVS